MTVLANEIKQKGVSIFEPLLQKTDEIIINVRGKDRFVVVDIERYKMLRDLELDKAYSEVQNDIKNGNYKTVTANEHLQDLIDAMQNSSN